MRDHAFPSLAIDDQPTLAEFRADIIHGFSQTCKSIPCKYLYDEPGSRLFDAICETDEYYLTRTEIGVMRQYRQEIAEAIGPNVMLIEPGAGSSVKIRLLLECLEAPAAFVPIDISGDHLVNAAAELADEFPDLEILPVCADFHQPFDLPKTKHACDRRLVYFPGSTIGNFDRAERLALLRRLAEIVGKGGDVLIGIDLIKDPRILEAAYDDAQGVTARFSLNLLARINRELQGDFDLQQFKHDAFWDPENERIEINLVSLCNQTAHVSGRAFRFKEGERIHTEYSHKFRIDTFVDSARGAGLRLLKSWSDDQRWFAILCFAVDETPHA